MKKGFLFCLLACALSYTSFAKTGLPCVKLPKKQFAIPINYADNNKPTVFYLPNSCSGLISDYVEGNGNLSVSVQGKIQDSQVIVRIKINFTGTAKSTLGLIQYSINGSINTSENRSIGTDPIDIFVKGNFKMMSKFKLSNLYLGDFGFITIFPDGSVGNHILDPENDPNYTIPNIYCSNPAGN